MSRHHLTKHPNVVPHSPLSMHDLCSADNTTEDQVQPFCQRIQRLRVMWQKVRWDTGYGTDGESWSYQCTNILGGECSSWWLASCVVTTSWWRTALSRVYTAPFIVATLAHMYKALYLMEQRTLLIKTHWKYQCAESNMEHISAANSRCTYSPMAVNMSPQQLVIEQHKCIQNLIYWTTGTYQPLILHFTHQELW